MKFLADTAEMDGMNVDDPFEDVCDRSVRTYVTDAANRLIEDDAFCYAWGISI